MARCCLLILLLLNCNAPIQAAVYRSTPTVWDILREQFMVDHHVNRPEVQAQLQWLLRHPDYLKRFAKAEPYIYHILTEIKKRNLPGEIALVPMIESAFDPFAYSGVGAAGLWQIMPETATDFGLKRDWWVEPRRSITSSTDMALKYYTYLHKFFQGNWLLAFAAYDSGEGKVARAVRQSGKTKNDANFWSLSLPQETKIYVPRLLALAEIIKHPMRYHVNLPHVLHEPYFEEVKFNQQIDLNHAAKLAGMSYQSFLRLNPGYNRWTTAPDGPHTLLLPKQRKQLFLSNLEKFPNRKTDNNWSLYKVNAGDTLQKLARTYRTTPQIIKKINQLKSDTLAKDQYILVPNTSHVMTQQKSVVAKPSKPQKQLVPEKTPYKIVHIVQKGDSFATLYQKYGVTESAIRTWNKIDKQHKVHVGQKLIIWKLKTHFA